VARPFAIPPVFPRIPDIDFINVIFYSIIIKMFSKMRGFRLGGAEMSQKHPNFLINTGDATAADLENLGEDVRKKVFQHAGITLEWEIMRVGEPAP